MPEYHVISCCTCKEKFYMSDHSYQTYKNNHATWYCPHGHQQHFVAGKTEAEKAREEADKMRLERDRQIQRNAQLQDEIKEEKARTAAYKGNVTKLKKRASAGLCPCCNRHFVNLERHIASKHPEINAEAA